MELLRGERELMVGRMGCSVERILQLLTISFSERNKAKWEDDMMKVVAYTVHTGGSGAGWVERNVKVQIRF